MLLTPLEVLVGIECCSYIAPAVVLVKPVVVLVKPLVVLMKLFVVPVKPVVLPVKTLVVPVKTFMPVVDGWWCSKASHCISAASSMEIALKQNSLSACHGLTLLREIQSSKKG